MKNQIATLLLAFSATLAAGASVRAFAGFEEESANLFNTMTNVTNPGAYMGASRGVITGGSIYQRNQITNARLVGVDFPSISAGCGGIDVFGGSFSFISADQFVQLMRNIASNAGSYAFKLALDNLCPSCMSNIDKLQQALQKMNDATANSCQIAKAGLHTILSTPGGAEKQPGELARAIDTSVIAPIGVATGRISDFFEGIEKRASGSAANKSAGIAQDLIKKAVVGNIVWTYLNDQSYSPQGWTQFSDNQLRNLIMSFTGTIVVTMPNNPNAPDQLPMVVPHKTLLTFKQMYEGSYRPDNPEQRLDSMPALFNCQEWDQAKYDQGVDTQCTEDSALAGSVPTQPIKGFKTRVTEVILGRDGQTGIVQVYREPTLQLDARMKGLIQIMPPEISPMIRNIAVRNRGAASAFVQKAAAPFSVDTAAYLANQLLDVIESAARQQSLKSNPYSAQIFQMVADKRKEINDYKAEVRLEYQDSGSALALYESYMAFTTQDLRQGPTSVGSSAEMNAGGNP